MNMKDVLLENIVSVVLQWSLGVQNATEGDA
jgi:hypothetical protein